jgi:hypothetical protein
MVSGEADVRAAERPSGSSGEAHPAESDATRTQSPTTRQMLAAIKAAREERREGGVRPRAKSGYDIR